MHEVGLVQSALDLAAAEAVRQGATRIHRITLRVGALAGVESEALAFAFDVASVGTLAEGAAFTIENVPAVCFCIRCRREFWPADVVYCCPSCGDLSSDIRQGRDLELTSLEVS